MDRSASMGRKIRILRERYNLTQKELSKIAGVGESTVRMWEIGNSIPRTKTMNTICDYFKVSPDWLYGYDTTSKFPASRKKGVRIPVLGRIPAGTPLEAIEEILDYEEVPEDWLNGGKEYFALQIEGNSMMPKYIEKDIVLFEKAEDCESGTDCAVIVNGNDATFKKVIKQDEGIVLQPLNTLEHEPKYYSSSDIQRLPIRIIGVAKEIRRQV